MKVFNANKDYNVGLYLRLSKEDGDKTESESISNQRKILKGFCEENNFKIYKEYVDDGFSGTNFDRPAFKEMINDIECGNINMVISKDLSRLGRDYSGIGNYIERYFPEHNVRFIAIYDEIDTITEMDDMVPLKAIINDLYSKELSRKYRAMLYNKKKEGMYISVDAPFGYKKDPNKKGHLIVDDIESQIVKRIFDMYINGIGCYKIARILNEENINTPAYNRKITSVSNEWSHNTIYRILRNETYIGSVVAGQRKKINYKSKKLITLPKSEWIITPNMHEPIISKSDFDIVQKMINSNNNSKVVKYDYLLRSIIKCKNCGNNISIITKKDKYKDKMTIRRYGICRKSERGFDVEKCVKFINYDIVEKLVLETIRNVIQTYLNKVDYKKILECQSKQKNTKLNHIESKIKELNNKIATINDNIDKLYIDKLENIINNMDFVRISEKLYKQRDELNKLLKENQNKYNEIKNIEEIQISDSKIKNILKNFCKLEKVTKQDLLKLVDKIYIDSNKNIEIVFRFKELNIINDKL